MGFFALISPGTVVQLEVAFVFSLAAMLITAVASPFRSHVNNYIAKAFGVALSAVFFFSLILKVHVLTESLENFLEGLLGTNFEGEAGSMAFDGVGFTEFRGDEVTAELTIAVAMALVVTTVITLQQLLHAAQTRIINY